MFVIETSRKETENEPRAYVHNIVHKFRKICHNFFVLEYHYVVPSFHERFRLSHHHLVNNTLSFVTDQTMA